MSEERVWVGVCLGGKGWVCCGCVLGGKSLVGCVFECV